MSPRWRTCCWPGCENATDSRYKMPVCARHASNIADRVDAINPRHRQHMRREKDRLQIEFLSNEKARLERVIRNYKAILQNEQLPTEEPKKSERPKDGLVYYLKNNGHIKIGWTSNLQRRMKSGFTPGSELLAVEPGTRSDERRLHKMFRAHLAFGNEWFAPVPSILHHVDMVREKHGEPPSIVVGARATTIPEPRPKQVTYPRGWSGGGKTSAA